MGYRNQFWTSSDSEPAFLQFTEKSYGDGYLETGNYCVPILWSACFSSADVNFGKLPDDQYPDEEQPIYGLSCDAPLPAAVARLERRLPSVKTVVVPSLHEICDLFVERLKQSHESFVHLHISELLNGDDDPSTGGWQDYWGRLVDGLDVPVTRVRKGAMGRFLGIGLPVVVEIPLVSRAIPSEASSHPDGGAGGFSALGCRKCGTTPEVAGVKPESPPQSGQLGGKCHKGRRRRSAGVPEFLERLRSMSQASKNPIFTPASWITSLSASLRA
jgi:hypothetical protein